MPRSYEHIGRYEKEILELREQGLTQREIGEKLGFSYKQVHNFMTRYNKKKKKLEAGIVIKPKGRPRKDGTSLPPSVEKLSKTAQLQYELDSKERYIKQLEMENELMKDFLLRTGRK